MKGKSVFRFETTVARQYFKSSVAQPPCAARAIHADRAGTPIVHRVVALRWLTILAWTAIVLGIALRVTQLPTRALYLDEAFTQMRVAGHTSNEMNRVLGNGRPIHAADVRRFATVGSDATPAKLVASLESEDAQHPPLFYVIELGAVKMLGNTVLAWRAVPVAFGCLAILAAFGLGRELFGTREAGLLAAAVFAVSPIERIYADQAREYSLFTFMLLVATMAVLRAVRAPNAGRWATYAVSLIAGLYANPFMLYVMAAHAVFVVSTLRTIRTRPTVLVAPLTACAVAIVAYAPWLLEMFIHRNDIAETNGWSAAHWPLVRLAAKWAFNSGATYFDLEYLDVRWIAILLPLAAVAVVALVRGFLAADIGTRWCLGAAIAVPAILLIAPDLALGQHRSSVARYGLPIWAMLAIVTARGLVGRPIAATVMLAAGTCACFVGAQHASWWDNDSNADNAAISTLVGHVPRAQILSSMPPIAFVGFAQGLAPAVTVILTPDLRTARFSTRAPLFVLRPSSGELRELEVRTGLSFRPVPLVKTRTAHDIGSTIAGAGSSPAIADLYEAIESNPGRNGGAR